MGDDDKHRMGSRFGIEQYDAANLSIDQKSAIVSAAQNLLSDGQFQQKLSNFDDDDGILGGKTDRALRRMVLGHANSQPYATEAKTFGLPSREPVTASPKATSAANGRTQSQAALQTAYQSNPKPATEVIATGKQAEQSRARGMNASRYAPGKEEPSVSYDNRRTSDRASNLSTTSPATSIGPGFGKPVVRETSKQAASSLNISYSAQDARSGLVAPPPQTNRHDGMSGYNRDVTPMKLPSPVVPVPSVANRENGNGERMASESVARTATSEPLNRPSGFHKVDSTVPASVPMKTPHIESPWPKDMVAEIAAWNRTLTKAQPSRRRSKNTTSHQQVARNTDSIHRPVLTKDDAKSPRIQGKVGAPQVAKLQREIEHNRSLNNAPKTGNKGMSGVVPPAKTEPQKAQGYNFKENPETEPAHSKTEEDPFSIFQSGYESITPTFAKPVGGAAVDLAGLKFVQSPPPTAQRRTEHETHIEASERRAYEDEYEIEIVDDAEDDEEEL